MFGFPWRSRDLKSHLRKTKTIRIDGIKFVIKKISPKDHLAGVDVILSYYKLYKKEKTQGEPASLLEGQEKLKKVMKDFIYAGVVSPKMTMKDEVKEDEVSIDELLSDMALAQSLVLKIIEYSYGKKK